MNVNVNSHMKLATPIVPGILILLPSTHVLEAAKYYFIIVRYIYYVNFLLATFVQFFMSPRFGTCTCVSHSANI